MNFLKSSEISSYLPENFFDSSNKGMQIVGRYYRAQVGPSLFKLQGKNVCDITPHGPTMNLLLERNDIAKLDGEKIDEVEGLIANTNYYYRSNDPATKNNLSYLLSPCDLQAIKACGVTFPASMIERVIEEKAQGDLNKAKEIREKVANILQGKIEDIEPGSENAQKVKDFFVQENLWSPYLEVGIGPFAEIFTKSQPMSSVGLAHPVGILPYSEWNNPEPEIVLLVNSKKKIMGATLGNDVNLRDIEGMSALLLGKAKDNNASCAIGPFIRLFDDSFGMEQIKKAEVGLAVYDNKDQCVLEDYSHMKYIRRQPENLVAQVINENHQYPDGLALFLGTMFAPSQDRDPTKPNKGFTHEVGDRVVIYNSFLGKLENPVAHTDQIQSWTFGTTELLKNLTKRKLLDNI